MKNQNSFKLFLFLCLSLAVVPGFAQENEDSPLEIELKAFLFSHGERESELTDDAEILPGQIIEYELIYKNTSSATLREVNASAGIPEGTAFVQGSATESDSLTPEFSVDGSNFSTPPIYIDVENEAGEIERREADVDAYRAIQWRIPELSGGEEKSLIYRVQVI